MSEFISLYDYLKKAAGNELGRKVARCAASKNVPHQIRHVSNPKYTGEVMLYPPEFLDSFFIKEEKVDLIEINTQLMEDSFNNENNSDKIY